MVIRLPRAFPSVSLEVPEGFRVVRVASQTDETVIELVQAAPVDLRVSDTERVLAQAGKRIYAIKAYRERTGVGLKDAKDAIDAAVPVTPY